MLAHASIHGFAGAKANRGWSASAMMTEGQSEPWTIHTSSWPDLFRPSTPLLQHEGVDAPDKHGHDG
jgi:hypothetical protein